MQNQEPKITSIKLKYIINKNYYLEKDHFTGETDNNKTHKCPRTMHAAVSCVLLLLVCNFSGFSTGKMIMLK